MSTANDLSVLSELVLSLSTLALHYLGETVISDESSGSSDASPEGVSQHQNLEIAKQNIEFIEVIAEKTKGNLTTAERGLIDMVLADLQDRLAKVDSSAAKA